MTVTGILSVKDFSPRVARSEGKWFGAAVIARNEVTKQSRSRARPLDCFASLAMTGGRRLYFPPPNASVSSFTLCRTISI